MTNTITLHEFTELHSESFCFIAMVYTVCGVIPVQHKLFYLQLKINAYKYYILITSHRNKYIIYVGCETKPFSFYSDYYIVRDVI